MEGFTFYQEEGRPFQGRKLEKMRSFLEQQGLDLDEKVQYSVILDTGEGKSGDIDQGIAGDGRSETHDLSASGNILRRLKLMAEPDSFFCACRVINPHSASSEMMPSAAPSWIAERK